MNQNAKLQAYKRARRIFAPVEPEKIKFAIQFEHDKVPRVVEAKDLKSYLEQLGYKLISVDPIGVGVCQAPDDGVLHFGEEIKFAVAVK